MLPNLAAPCTLVLLLLLGVGEATAQTVYRCKSPQGVVYSQQPCAKDAEKREMRAPPQTDDQWVAKLRREWTPQCVETMRNLLPETPEDQMTIVCRCTIERYINEVPVETARQLEKDRDVEGNSALMRPRMLQCYQATLRTG